MSAALELIDSHSHIDVDSYSGDREATITRARAAGVIAQIVPAIEAATWKQLAEIWKIKKADMNAKDEAAGIKIIAGTARNMGIDVID